MRIAALDFTLGHRAEGQALYFSPDDRLAIARRLDRLGMAYIDGGSPGGDRTARDFFARAQKECRLTHASLVASMRLDAIRGPLAADSTMRAVLEADTPVVALAGCGWHAGLLGLGEYCRRISETVRFLKAHRRVVIFRADDFFEGYCADPAFALRMLEAAKTEGADILCLADSAGATLPHVLREICLEVRKRFEGTLGIRAHDQASLAVANTLDAVEQGFTHIEGTLNAFGPLAEDANLCAIIANLEFKLGHTVVGRESLESMPGVARFIVDAGSLPIRREAHPDEEALLASIDERLTSRLTPADRSAVLERVRLLEGMGFHLQTARGTLELLVRQALAPDMRPFEPERYELTSHSGFYSEAMSSAVATIRAGEAIRSESEEGEGPLNALERALRQCLFAVYPVIANIRLKDYTVHVLEAGHGAGSRVRVNIEWAESGERWITAGVAGDLIEAAWLALVDGFRLALMRLGEGRYACLPNSADTPWAV